MKRFDYQAFGARLRAARKARDLSLAELSVLTGNSVSAISRFERGVMLPSLPQLLTIAGMLYVSASDLLEGGDDV